VHITPAVFYFNQSVSCQEKMMSLDLKQMPQTNNLNPSAETQTLLTGLVTRRLRRE
jgi:hypothetical protein